jgi:hypothetical protein
MCISVNANPPPISYVIKVFTQVICSRDPGLVFPDPGSPALISESLVKISWVKNTIILCQLAQHFCEFCGYKTGWIWDLRSGSRDG